MIAQAIVLYCTLGSAPNCISLAVPFRGVATQASCAHAISVAEPSFLRDNPGYARLKDSPIECVAVGGVEGGDA